MRRWARLLTIAAVILPGVRARGDQFDAIEGKALAASLKGPDAKAVTRLTFGEIGALPDLFKDARGALLAVKTAKGNVARLLVAPALRKEESGGAPIAVFVVERFDTFDAADLSARLAGGRGVMLFPGFQLDLDTGQIVPEGQGGDVGCVKDGPTLVTLGGSALYSLTKAPAPDPTKPPQPTPGRAVVPGDFAGRYKLHANGQWSGTLDLTVNDDGEVSGQFRSDLRGSSYAVVGKVAADAKNKVTMTVKFPRSEGEFEGYLWTEGKGAMAGTFRLLDRAYGFYAVREGAK